VPEPDEIDLIEYLKVLWKWKWLIVGGMVLAGISSFIVASRTPRMFEASVTLLLASSRIPGAPGIPDQPTLAPETFADIMKGKSLAAEVIQHFGLDKPPHKMTVDSFVSRSLSVKPLEEKGLIRLTVTLPDPQLAAEATSFLGQKAVELQARLNQGGALATRDFFQQRRDQAWQALEHARAALRNFTRAANLDSLEIERRIALEEKARLKIRATQLSTEQAGLRTRGESLSRALKQEEPVLTLSKSIATDPSLLAAAAEYGATDVKALSSLQLKSQEVNATYQEIRKELINAEASLASHESEQRAVERKAEENRKRLAELDQTIDSFRPKLEGLTQSYQQAQATYQFWNSKGDEAVLLNAARTPDLKIVDPAITPIAPISRQVMKKVIFAGAMGLITCAFLAFFMEYFLRVRQRQGVVR